MRQRTWNLVTLFGTAICVIIGILVKLDPIILVMGFGFGATVILIIHNTYGSDRDYDRETERLKSEGKYRKTISCSNCGTRHYFTPSHGVCMLEFLQDEKCTNCKCLLKDTVKPTTEGVKQ